MKKSSQTEIVIPTWADRRGPSYWGDIDYGSHDNQSTSFWLSLRRVVPSDNSYLNDDSRAICDIGLYVWISIDGTVSIDVRLHEVGSVSLYEGVQRIKLLKRLHARGKAYAFNNFQRGTNVQVELTKALGALGIRRALVHHEINQCETYEPVGPVIQRIGDNIKERLDRMKQCRAA
ncbi:hypothetical protein [Rhodoferax ferrireducens]|uniref:hypothetical protein n=1 Tax=Rhodoferax ferrireducens TaxID=192843 RepID=UPI000E0DF9A5|nr:hypothetical protein [Rhodoferax ferrireducens]